MNTCLNCGNIFEKKYCNNCGEKVFHPSQNSFQRLAEEAFHFFTHFDSKFLKTLKVILTKPSQYTLEYIRGIKVKYYKPVPFFIMTVFIYVINPVKFDGLANKLDSQLTSTGFSELKQSMMEEKMKVKGIDQKFYEIRYNSKCNLVSKTFIFIFLPIWCFFISIFNLVLRRKRTIYENFIASIELNGMNIWASFMLSPLLLWPVILLFGEDNPAVQLIPAIPVLTYATVFFSKYFDRHWAIGLLLAIVLMGLDLALLPYYRLTLFYLTNWKI